MRSVAVLLCALLILSWLPNTSASAAERWSLPAGQQGWRILKVPGVAANRFRVQEQVLEIQSAGSASFRYLELPSALTQPTQVSWDWRVEQHSPLSTQTAAGQDDRPLAVHIWFEDTTDGSLFGTLGTLFGYPKVGRLMTYVWGAEEPAGSILPNPHYAKGKVFVLVGDDGRKGQWQTVRRDIAQDYQRAFGQQPDLKSLRYVAVSADSDDLNGYSTAAIRALSFISP